MQLSSLPGTVLDGRYLIERQLGQGGMGAVFAATHIGTTRTVAVKLIVPQLADQDEFLLRFQREAEAAGRLRHPNVVNATDFGFTSIGGNQVAYLVMEFLDGESLSAYLKHTPQPPLDLILEIIEQTALGLDAAHAAGIVHRDLKPDNIGLESNRRGGFNIKVLDFGIAKLADSTAALAPKPAGPVPAFRAEAQEFETVATTAAGTVSHPEMETAFLEPVEPKTAPSISTSHRMTNASTLQTTVGSVLGTPAFMSPEQCQGEAVDHRADVYSLAVIAYKLFCGRLPFEARNVRELLEQQIHSTPPAPSDLDKSIPSGVSKAILQGLAKNPEQRQSSTGMLAAQIRSGAQGELGILSDGKFYSGAYTECFLPLLFACFSPILVVQLVVLLAAGAIFRAKLLSALPLLLLVNAVAVVTLLFLANCYKAACAMVFQDAATKGFFRPQVKEVILALARESGTLLRMFFSVRNWTSFYAAALWPDVWVAEKKTGAEALERAHQLGFAQPEAAFALMARQYGVMLMAGIVSTVLLVGMTGSAQEYAKIMFSGQILGWFLALYPAIFTPMFSYTGTSFHFLYRAGRRCLGEEVANNLPAASRTKRPKKASFVRPGTLLWIVPPIGLVSLVAYRLLSQSPSTIQFIDAMTEGRRTFVLRQIDSGTPVDTPDLRKRTPLMHAVIDGDMEAVQQLLKRGAKLEARSSTGATPLIFALQSRRHEIAKLLLDRGANVNAADDEKQTALMVAAIHGDLEGCRLLLDRGASTALRNYLGKSATDLATEEQHAQVGALLSSR